MNKLPVFRTAGRAIGFTFWNSFTIFRLAWLPIALLLAAEIGLSAYIMRLEGETLRALPNPFTVGMILERVLAFNLAFLVLQMIVFAAVAVSIHRVILFGDRRPGQYLNFAFGKTEFLYIVMGLLTALIVLAVLAAVFAPLVLIVSGGDPVGMFNKFTDDPESFLQAAAIKSGLRSGWMVGFMVVYFAAYILVIYLSLRLAVWPPSIVATNRISPSEPWQLTRGNVWRLIGAFILTFGWIYLALVVPAVAAYWYYTSKMALQPEVPAITAPADPGVDAPTSPPAPVNPLTIPGTPLQREVTAPSGPAPATTPATPEPDVEMEVELQDPDDQLRELDARFAPFALVMWVVSLFIYIYFTALAVAVVSFSYKALKGYEPYEPIADA